MSADGMSIDRMHGKRSFPPLGCLENTSNRKTMDSNRKKRASSLMGWRHLRGYLAEARRWDLDFRMNTRNVRVSRTFPAKSKSRTYRKQYKTLNRTGNAERSDDVITVSEQDKCVFVWGGSPCFGDGTVTSYRSKGYSIIRMNNGTGSINECIRAVTRVKRRA